MSNETRPIAVGVDGSDDSLRAVDWAAGVADRSGAPILLVHASQPLAAPLPAIYASLPAPAEEGDRILAEARDATGLPIVTEVLDAHDVPMVASYADMLQVGTRNMQNFQLLKEVGMAGKPVLLKRGLTATIDEWVMAAEYIAHTGNLQIVLVERGIRTYEPMTRNTLDISAVPVAQSLTHLPVIIDPSHSGGKRDLVLPLVRAGIAVGADGLIVDVHPRPEIALCDGPQALPTESFADYADQVRRILPADSAEELRVNALRNGMGRCLPARDIDVEIMAVNGVHRALPTMNRSTTRSAGNEQQLICRRDASLGIAGERAVNDEYVSSIEPEAIGLHYLSAHCRHGLD
jgi:3-deoxy-7-phosphoheptulonate synthase